MGYSITIGQIEIEKQPDEGVDCSCISFGAKGERHDTAPAHGDSKDYTNSRWSYSAWSDCMSDLGLYDLYFNGGKLIGGRPGVRLVTKQLVDETVNRLDKFRAENPTVKASYTDLSNRLNATYCRAEWLEYWLKWALNNCETPVIANN